MSDSTSDESAEQIGEWLAVLIEPGSTVEMRVLSQAGKMRVQHYQSDDLSRMALDALQVGRGAKGVYWLMNPLPADWEGGTAKDGDIVRRRWLLVDCDPKRKGTVSSTDAEKELAYEKAFAVATFLESLGWPMPIIADSGNGCHLLYRIDFPADDGGLVARVLKALARQFTDNAVDIDIKVGNASRICKLYGSVAAKGENTPDRPHRVSKITTIPESLDVVPVEMLRKLASEGEQPPAPALLLPSHPDTGSRVSHSVAIVQARNYLVKMAPSIEGEHGGNRLIHAASVLVNDFGVTDSEAFDLLMTEFNPRCVPPWPESELWRKISEAKKHPPSRTPKGLAASNNIDDSETTHIVEEPWPASLHPDAFHGVAGEIVGKIEPHTEADPVALLIQLLVVVGNVLGRHCYCWVESTRHYANLFGVLVGSSSTGRKGTAGDHVNRLIQQVDPDWFSERLLSGLVSGEGVIWNVRDATEKQVGGREAGGRVDDGISDKRLMIYESEFSSALKAKGRDSNTLSEVLRQCWDSGRLRTAAKNSPAKATDAYVSLIGHITPEELREVTREVDKANGLANRFLWCCVNRSQLLPDGGQIHTVDFGRDIETLRHVVEFASQDREIARDREAAEEWRRLYPLLTRERPGTLGAICNRAAAQVVRLSLLYALLDRSEEIRIEHLRAALALWQYCEASVTYVFGHSLADRTADTIFRALNSNGTNGLSRTAISDLFKRNKSKSDLDGALQKLHSAKLARRETIGTGGRPTEVWYATG